MNKIRHHLEEARLTRDTARKIVNADWSYIKLMLEPRQIAHRAREEAEKIADQAQDVYEENPQAVKGAAALAALIGAIWAGTSLKRRAAKRAALEAEHDAVLARQQAIAALEYAEAAEAKAVQARSAKGSAAKN